MRKSLILCFLTSLLLVATNTYSQNCSIDTRVDIINANLGQANGRIEFKINGQVPAEDRFIIFDLSAVKIGAKDRIKLAGNVVDNLASGQYEFLIVDKQKEKCSKEILVEIKEQ